MGKVKKKSTRVVVVPWVHCNSQARVIKESEGLLKFEEYSYIVKAAWHREPLFREWNQAPVARQGLLSRPC